MNGLKLNVSDYCQCRDIFIDVLSCLLSVFFLSICMFYILCSLRKRMEHFCMNVRVPTSEHIQLNSLKLDILISTNIAPNYDMDFVTIFQLVSVIDTSK